VAAANVRIRHVPLAVWWLTGDLSAVPLADDPET
jgi:hypothetical protein